MITGGDIFRPEIEAYEPGLDCAEIRRRLNCTSDRAHRILRRFGKRCGRRHVISRKEFERLVREQVIRSKG